MPPTSHIRGHKIIFIGRWIYADDGSPADYDRPCVRCGEMPRDGRDACMGDVEGVVAACCGHGVEDGYLVERGKVDG